MGFFNFRWNSICIGRCASADNPTVTKCQRNLDDLQRQKIRRFYMKQEKHEKLLVPYVSDENFCEEFEVKIDKL